MALVVSPIDEWWSLVLGVAPFGVACVVVVPRHWRGDTGYLRREHRPGDWPFGMAAWKGFTRASPVFVVIRLLTLSTTYGRGNRPNR